MYTLLAFILLVFLVSKKYIQWLKKISRQKSDVEFCYLTRLGLKNSAESGERSVFTLGFLCPSAVCGIQREAFFTIII